MEPEIENEDNIEIKLDGLGVKKLNMYGRDKTGQFVKGNKFGELSHLMRIIRETNNNIVRDVLSPRNIKLLVRKALRVAMKSDKIDDYMKVINLWENATKPGNNRLGTSKNVVENINVFQVPLEPLKGKEKQKKIKAVDNSVIPMIDIENIIKEKETVGDTEESVQK